MTGDGCLHHIVRIGIADRYLFAQFAILKRDALLSNLDGACACSDHHGVSSLDQYGSGQRFTYQRRIGLHRALELHAYGFVSGMHVGRAHRGDVDLRHHHVAAAQDFAPGQRADAGQHVLGSNPLSH